MKLISTLSVENFKSIRKIHLDCKRINLFIGEPNTGKSNILESIGLLSYIYHGNGVNLKDFVRIDNPTNIFYDNELSENVIITFDEKRLNFSYKDGSFEGSYPKDNHRILLLNEHGENISLEKSTDFRKFKFYRFQSQSRFPNTLSEYLNPPKGDNLVSILYKQRNLRGLIKRILNNYKYKLVLNLVEKSIQIEKELEDIIVAFPYHLLSETFQHIFFYLAAIISNKDSIIAFEEPEAHAFPQFTKFLAERIALEKTNQFFISTHNPYFAFSLIEKAHKDEINIYLTYMKEYETHAKLLSQEKIEMLLDLGIDLFFNFDKLLGEDV